jgi:small-conductance mechanosensitive channel
LAVCCAAYAAAGVRHLQNDMRGRGLQQFVPARRWHRRPPQGMKLARCGRCPSRKKNIELWNRLTHVTFAGNTLQRWLIALAVALAVWLLLTLLLRTALKRADRLSARSANQWDDVLVAVLHATRRWVLAAVAVLAFVEVLTLAPRWEHRVGQLWFVLLVVQLALWTSRGLQLLLERQLARHANVARAGASATLLSWALQTVLWTTVVLAVLANLGVNITAMVTSLGVGGIAVALAVQNILGDLFASLAITLDKPFEVGDAIAVGGISGTVERVGLKTTRLRAPSGEQIVMSNAELLKGAVSNYKRQETRRIVFKLAIALDTPAGQAAWVSGMLRKVIEGRDGIKFDRAHLQRIGESALEYEAVYIVQRADYAFYMDQQQDMLLQIKQQLDDAGIEFAMPRTLLEHAGDDAAPSKAATQPQGGPETVPASVARSRAQPGA